MAAHQERLCCAVVGVALVTWICGGVNISLFEQCPSGRLNTESFHSLGSHRVVLHARTHDLLVNLFLCCLADNVAAPGVVLLCLSRGDHNYCPWNRTLFGARGIMLNFLVVSLDTPLLTHQSDS